MNHKHRGNNVDEKERFAIIRNRFPCYVVLVQLRQKRGTPSNAEQITTAVTTEQTTEEITTADTTEQEPEKQMVKKEDILEAIKKVMLDLGEEWPLEDESSSQ